MEVSSACWSWMDYWGCVCEAIGLDHTNKIARVCLAPHVTVSRAHTLARKGRVGQRYLPWAVVMNRQRELGISSLWNSRSRPYTGVELDEHAADFCSSNVLDLNSLNNRRARKMHGQLVHHCSDFRLRTNLGCLAKRESRSISLPVDSWSCWARGPPVGCSAAEISKSYTPSYLLY